MRTNINLVKSLAKEPVKLFGHVFTKEILSYTVIDIAPVANGQPSKILMEFTYPIEAFQGGTMALSIATAPMQSPSSIKMENKPL